MEKARFKWVLRERNRKIAAKTEVFTEQQARRVRSFHSSFKEYSPTPLIELTSLAHKTSLGANKRGFYFYSLTFRQFAGFRVIRPRGHSSFFSKIFCLSVDTPARQRALLVTTGYLTVTVV